MRISILSFAFCFLATFRSALAEENPKFPVEVVNKSTDTVGGRLVFGIKEKIRGSNTFRIADVSEERIQIIINTIDQDSKYPGSATIYSVIWAFPPSKELPLTVLLNNAVGSCGTLRIDGVADSIVAETDKLKDHIGSMFRK